MSIETSKRRIAEERFLFPRWANYLVPALVILAIGVLTYIPLVLGLFLSPETTDVGYQPEQPVAFSHQVHAGDLGMDCRYCHWSIERTSYAALPSTKICMNCHASIRSESDKLQSVRDSYASGESISWIKVHKAPDFVFFDHASHINQGVGCTSCHGRIDQMETVFQDQPLSMAWCLECHRNPERHLRPRTEITNMDWNPADVGKTQRDLGTQLMAKYDIHEPAIMTNCTVCHR